MLYHWMPGHCLKVKKEDAVYVDGEIKSELQCMTSWHFANLQKKKTPAFVIHVHP